MGHDYVPSIVCILANLEAWVVCVCACVYAHVCVHVHMCVHVCMHIHVIIEWEFKVSPPNSLLRIRF